MNFDAVAVLFENGKFYSSKRKQGHFCANDDDRVFVFALFLFAVPNLWKFSLNMFRPALDYELIVQNP